MNKKTLLKKFKLTERQFSGEEKISGFLNLGTTPSIPEGFNPTIEGSLYLNYVTSIPAGFNPVVGGHLSLRSVISIPDDFNPVVGGDLNLNSITAIPGGFNPMVGGDLNLRSVASIPAGFNPTVGGCLNLGSVTCIPEGFNPVAGGFINLGAVTSIPKGFNPVAGSFLNLGSITSIPEDFNPAAGDDLYLNSATGISEGFNPIAGGDLCLSSLASVPENCHPVVGGYLELKDSKIYIGDQSEKSMFFRKTPGKMFAKIDGIFCEVLSERHHIINDQVYRLFSAKRINRDDCFFFAGKGHMYAHGENLKKAIEDLEFKLASDNIKKEPIHSDTMITVKYYRMITGACELGCNIWLQDNRIEQEQMKASELLPLLENTRAYGLDTFKRLVSF